MSLTPTVRPSTQSYLFPWHEKPKIPIEELHACADATLITRVREAWDKADKMWELQQEAIANEEKATTNAKKNLASTVRYLGAVILSFERKYGVAILTQEAGVVEARVLKLWSYQNQQIFTDDTLEDQFPHWVVAQALTLRVMQKVQPQTWVTQAQAFLQGGQKSVFAMFEELESASTQNILPEKDLANLYVANLLVGQQTLQGLHTYLDKIIALGAHVKSWSQGEDMQWFATDFVQYSNATQIETSLQEGALKVCDGVAKNTIAYLTESILQTPLDNIALQYKNLVTSGDIDLACAMYYSPELYPILKDTVQSPSHHTVCSDAQNRVLQKCNFPADYEEIEDQLCCLVVAWTITPAGQNSADAS